WLRTPQGLCDRRSPCRIISARAVVAAPSFVRARPESRGAGATASILERSAAGRAAGWGTGQGLLMTTAQRQSWQVAGRVRHHALGWRSQPAIQRVREAVSEIKKAARSDPVLAAEGAVVFLEKVSPALERVDSSSGAIGTAVNHAIEELVSIIAKAPVDPGRRGKWVDRLWNAYIVDTIPYIETLGEFWGEMCSTKELASIWADNLVESLRATWRDRGTSSYFQGTTVCLSSLLAAGRYQELLDLLEMAPYVCWHNRSWGVRALAAMGNSSEAIKYAEASRGPNVIRTRSL